jgi:pantoate--beta-alanine ligase
MTMRVARTIDEVRAAVHDARSTGNTIGIVPTMGWFHEGHLSLMRRAREVCGFVVVSLFVNPTQFNEPADLEAYPRDEGRDARMADAVGVDLLFVPSADEIYPDGFSTSIIVGGVSESLEGVSRGASHFRGVATVVTKLFNIVSPDIAFFGQKDAQQALVIRRLVRDLDLPVAVEVCPTIREPDGLAMSSRNVRLDRESRERALALRRGLDAVEEAIGNGVRDAAALEQTGRDTMTSLGLSPEYFAVVSAELLKSFAAGERVRGEVLIAVAAHVGSVRLIDNAVVVVDT